MAMRGLIHVVDLFFAAIGGRDFDALDVAAFAGFLGLGPGVVVPTRVVAVIIWIVVVVADAAGFEVVEDEAENFRAAADGGHLGDADVPARGAAGPDDEQATVHGRAEDGAVSNTH